MNISTIAAATLFVMQVTAFAPSRSAPSINELTVCEAQLSRRSILTKTSAGLASIAAVGVFSSPVFAEVSSGTSLPDGAAQFKRLLNLQNDLAAVTKRVSDTSSEIDKKEWDNLSDFMKKVYKGGDDMKAFAKTSIYEPEKKKKAEEDFKLLQKLAQAGDGPISKQDPAGVAVVLKKCNATIEDFLELLRDIPDEI